MLVIKIMWIIHISYIKPFAIYFLKLPHFFDFSNLLFLETYDAIWNVNALNFEKPYEDKKEVFSCFNLSKLYVNIKVKRISFLIGYDKRINAFYEGLYTLQEDLKSYTFGIKLYSILINFNYFKGQVIYEETENLHLVNRSIGFFWGNKSEEISKKIMSSFLLSFSGSIDYFTIKNKNFLFTNANIFGKIIFFKKIGIYGEFTFSPYLYTYSVYKEKPFKIRKIEDVTLGIIKKFDNGEFVLGLGLSRLFLTGNIVGITPFAWKLKLGGKLEVSRWLCFKIECDFRYGSEDNIIKGYIAEIISNLCIKI